MAENTILSEKIFKNPPPEFRGAPFYEKYGYDIVEKLPEFVWNLSGDKPSSARYNYYAHASELFASSYCDRIGGGAKSTA